MMKNIFSIVPELLYVPKKLQFMVSSMMHVKNIKAGETIISDNESHPNAFVIAEGAFYSCLPTEIISSKVFILSDYSPLVEESQNK